MNSIFYRTNQQMKSATSVPLIPLILLVLLILLILLFVYGSRAYWNSRRPHVWDLWVINLDKDTHRWKSIQDDTQKLAGMVHRWPAVNGKALTQQEMVNQGVGFAMTRLGSDYKDAGLRNVGTVGCWLSHKQLLTHLANLNVSEHAGHLILEDDVAVPADFLDLTDTWHTVYHRIPTDWDMVYLGITNPHGTLIAPGIRKLETKQGGGANWGTHAYLVRNGSIRTKILPWLTHMVDAIDEQYNLKFSEWNVYAVEPSIIPLKPELSQVSSLQQINLPDKV